MISSRLRLTAITALTLLPLVPLASAQDSGLGLSQAGEFGAQDAAASTHEDEAGLTRSYPVTLEPARLSKLGATPNTAYILLRDIKPLLGVRANSGTITISNNKSLVRFRPGSRAATLNGMPANLGATPVATSEATLFPLKALKLLSCTWEPLEPMKTVRTFGVRCPDSDQEVTLQAITLHNRNAAPGAVQPNDLGIQKLRARR